tara:strand:+ start:726 stop:947 length:222 start_codon:yes stop_codon:yes gene_type:complete
MKLYIIDLPGHNVPDRAFSSKEEAVKAVRAYFSPRAESGVFYGVQLDLPATKAGLILAYEAGFGDGQQHGESI